MIWFHIFKTWGWMEILVSLRDLLDLFHAAVVPIKHEKGGFIGPLPMDV